jgi:hypothetical protein
MMPCEFYARVQGEGKSLSRKDVAAHIDDIIGSFESNVEEAVEMIKLLRQVPDAFFVSVQKRSHGQEMEVGIFRIAVKQAREKMLAFLEDTLAMAQQRLKQLGVERPGNGPDLY